MKKINKIWIASKTPLWLASFLTNVFSIFTFFSKKYPLYTKRTLKQQPVFILASGRSGNTLLRSMLTCTQQMSIPPESYVLPKIIRLYCSINYKNWDQICDLIIGEFEQYKEFYTWGIKLDRARDESKKLLDEDRSLASIIDRIYCQYAEFAGVKSQRWGDKTPINSVYSNWIIKVFPEANYIHLKRDPRAVAVSYKKAGLYNDLRSGFRFWEIANKKINRVKNDNFFTLSYESLISKPKETLVSLCQFLDISYSDDMLEHHKKSNNLGDVSVHKHHERTTKAIDKNNAENWKNNITEEENKILDEWYKKYRC